MLAAGDRRGRDRVSEAAPYPQSHRFQDSYTARFRLKAWKAEVTAGLGFRQASYGCLALSSLSDRRKN